ncbi:unnamed protein product [Brassica napus]|uniref:(rape) hypothetical protein n=1 Tax=Brassica napus TaxID=3708 RepID=A0A816M4F3_BRANA|nr:unnamed protein product [Brassica napus]
MATTMRIFRFVLMSFAVLLGCCSARIYKVGDSKGWTAKDDAFHVGDSLAFNPIINDVTQVSGSLEYELCDYSFPKVSITQDTMS